MRRFMLGGVLSLAVLLPNVGTAQVLMRPNAYPQVTAANAPWLLRGDPVFHAGALYYPTGPTVFFDGNVMRRTNTFQGVPVYEDATLTPFSVVYVPIGGSMVRPYERRRDGELAGTAGSRTPSFPIQLDGQLAVRAADATGVMTPPVNVAPPVVSPDDTRLIRTAGSTVPLSAIARTTILTPASRVMRRASVAPILEVWVPYDGARWFSAGSAVAYSSDRFVQVGEYRGFPVYRDKNRSADEIYIPSVAGGTVAPYRKNR